MAEENIIEEAGSGLGHKLGPLPVWAWLVIGVVGAAGIYYVVVARKSSSSSQGFPGGVDLGSLLGAGGGGGATPGSTSPAPTTAQLTNAQWLDTAVGKVASALNLPAQQVRLYLEGYLAGTPFATSKYESVVNQALSLGAPPQGAALPSVNSSPFTSNTAWLDDILQYLPAGTSNGVKNELIAWVNGVSTTLSTDAQTALAAAQDVVGQAPSPISFTTPGAPSGPPAGPSFTDELTTAFQSLPHTNDLAEWNKTKEFLKVAFGLSDAQATNFTGQYSDARAAGVPISTARLNDWLAFWRKNTAS